MKRYGELAPKTQTLIDAAILAGETERIMGRNYPDGETSDPRRGPIQPQVADRIRFLQELYAADIQAETPYYYPWHTLASQILRDAQHAQTYAQETDGAHTVGDFIPLLQLPYAQQHYAGEAVRR